MYVLLLYIHIYGVMCLGHFHNFTIDRHKLFLLLSLVVHRKSTKLAYLFKLRNFNEIVMYLFCCVDFFLHIVVCAIGRPRMIIFYGDIVWKL